MGCPSSSEPPVGANGVCAWCEEEGVSLSIRRRRKLVLTTAEVAEKLGRSAVTVRRMLSDGELPGRRLRTPRSNTGNRWVVLETDLEGFLQRSVTAAPRAATIGQ
jgi:excisionase family DNA binding protein